MTKPILRSDIEKGLRELKSYESGNQFQELAVQIGKQYTPGLMACERKWDRGLDAISEDEKTGLASSLSGSLAKIKKDADKIKKHFSKFEKLYFATTEVVSTHTINEWKAEIKKTYGYELTVLPRAEIISKLLEPKNENLCRSILKMSESVIKLDEELMRQIKEAAAEEAANWSRNLKGPIIPLDAIELAPFKGESSEICNIDELSNMLLVSERLVLEAPGGAGKTTLLIELSKVDDEKTVCIVINLAEWVRSGSKSIFAFISSLISFKQRKISEEDLLSSSKAVHFNFLLNGWNEVSTDNLESLKIEIIRLERECPNSGIIVATRNIHSRPALPNSRRFLLRPLNRKQRSDYIVACVPEKASELKALIIPGSSLDEITRTPMFLSHVIAIFNSGATLPKTKMGILSSVLNIVENDVTHQSALANAPIQGCAKAYLEEVSMQMTEQNEVNIEEDAARRYIDNASETLVSRKQLNSKPAPKDVLEILAGKHILERTSSEPNSYRLRHQQFQEYFNALVLKRKLADVINSRDEKQKVAYLENYINQPKWEEPLKMITEELSSEETQLAIECGEILLLLALKVDILFAAKLAQLAGEKVWAKVSKDFSGRLRQLYNDQSNNLKQLALEAMLTTGSADFNDILAPLFTTEEGREKLRYTFFQKFHMSSLGPDWQKLVRTWDDKAKAQIFSEPGAITDVAAMTEFAKTESIKIKKCVIDSLQWRSSEEHVEILLKTLSKDELKSIIPKLHLETLTEESKALVIETLNEELKSLVKPKDKIYSLLNLLKLGVEKFEEVKAELEKASKEELSALEHTLQFSIIPLLKEKDPEWLSNWTAKRVSNHVSVLPPPVFKSRLYLR